MTRALCCDPRRQDEVRGRAGTNGIDFLEVLDGPGIPDADRQRFLFVHFLNDPAGLPIGPANIALRGGVRLRGLRVLAAAIAVDARSGSPLPVLVVEVASPGDFAPYTLTLEETPAAPGALAVLDSRMRSVEFSFKAACESDFDAALAAPCPPPGGSAPAIDYRARDFRPLLQLLQDRYALLTGDAETGHPADAATTMLEWLAHLGDVLAYRQDAAATEAKLDTARHRISGRRHARLVDERMQDGCNARVFAQVAVQGGPHRLPRGTRLITGVTGLPRVFAPTSPHWAAARNAGAVVFETMRDTVLDGRLNRIAFHSWGDGACTLPRGTTQATLHGDLTGILRAGDVLVLAEVASPRTGNPADAELRRRQAVRLTAVEAAVDPIGGLFQPVPFDGPLAVTEISWHPEDALDFPLVLSAESATGVAVPQAAIAWGNIVLADHGRTLDAEEGLGVAPIPILSRRPAETGARLVTPGETAGCAPCTDLLLPPRFRPRLAEAPLTHAVALPEAPASARATLHPDPTKARPALLRLVSLREDGLEEDWLATPDLLRSGNRREVVVELEEGGAAVLRFGQGDNGRAPTPHSAFRALYRVGLGEAGNIGAETLAHIVTDQAALLALADGALVARNPLAAIGGRAPESLESLRRRAPHAFRARQERAVTAADYAARCVDFGGVQQAAATLRWTGSWHSLFLSVDRVDDAEVDGPFVGALTGHLERYRMMGHDLAVERPVEVAVDLTAQVTIGTAHSRANLRRALLAALGPAGLFDPDRLTFGQTVYLSPIYAALQAVEGVERVLITRFERRDAPGPAGLAEGALRFGRLEIARLANDPNRPERGVLTLDLRGGQ